MTKTPEQMAEEFFENWQPEKPKYTRPKARQYALEKVTECFLAGYQAAKDEMNSPEKLDSSNSLNNSNGWISVKERLPELDKDVLIYINFMMHDITWKHLEIASWNGTCWDTSGDTYHRGAVSHWMDIPTPPEGKDGN